MKFKIKVKFNGLYNNSEVERIVDEKDWPIEMGILKAMVMSREIDSFKVTLDSFESLECTCFNCETDCEVLQCIN